MRHMPLAAACLAVAACAEPADLSLGTLAGPTNIAALDAAAACRNDEALRLTSTELASPDPSRRLMAHVVTAAVLTDQGRSDAAGQVIAEAAADPGLNPEGQDPASFGQTSAATLAAIRRARVEETGSPTC